MYVSCVNLKNRMNIKKKKLKNVLGKSVVISMDEQEIYNFLSIIHYPATIAEHF